MLINRTGTFRGLALESQVGLTKKGFPQFVFRAQATEWYDTETGQWFDYSTEDANEITGYLVLFSADGTPIFHIKDIVETFKWDGQTMGGLDAVDISKIPFQFTVEENLYNEVTSLKVCKIAPFDAIPGGSLRKLDPASLKALDAKFAASLLKNAGGKKPVSAPAKKPTMPTPPTMNAAPAVAEPTGGVGSTDDPAPVTTPPAAAAATPPKRTRKPKAATPAEATAMTMEQAWENCVNMKAKTITDEQLATAWSAACFKIAGEADDQAITPEQWVQIADEVQATTGIF